jgi:guanylate kinase
MLMVVGPSGVGKNAIVEKLMESHPEMKYSLSCTTRPPREGEVNGEDYWFLDEGTFEEKRDQGVFLEHAIYNGYRYGTPRGEIYRYMIDGHSVVLVVDMKGADIIRKKMASEPDRSPLKNGFIDVFIAPKSLEVLRERILSRQGEIEEEDMLGRLKIAEEQELPRQDEFSHCIINDDLERAVEEMDAIVSGAFVSA